MVTRKKKTTVIESADVAEMTNVPSVEWPMLTRGTHLTVKTFKNGHTELIWDDDQLLKEVKEAIASAELADMKPAVRAKVATRKKKENK